MSTQEEICPPSPPRTTDEVANIDLTFIPDAWCADMLRDAMNAVVLAQLDPEMSKNEIDVWARLDHPNIVKVWDHECHVHSRCPQACFLLTGRLGPPNAVLCACECSSLR